MNSEYFTKSQQANNWKQEAVSNPATAQYTREVYNFIRCKPHEIQEQGLEGSLAQLETFANRKAVQRRNKVVLPRAACETD